MADLVLAGRWVVGIVLLHAGLLKLLVAGEVETRRAVARYGVLPERLVAPAARSLPWVEIVLGGALCAGVLLVPVAWCAAALLFVFAVAVGWHVARGARFGCGCGQGTQISWSLAARDGILGLIAVGIALEATGDLALWAGPGASEGVRAVASLLPVPLAVVLVALVGALLTQARRPAAVAVDVRGAFPGRESEPR